MRSNQRYRSRRRRELGSIKSSSLKLDFISDALDSRITYAGGAYRTKYDANGVLGYAPHNLALQSEDYATETYQGWKVSGAAVSSNVSGITAPDGTETADGLVADGGTYHHVWQGFEIGRASCRERV